MSFDAVSYIMGKAAGGGSDISVESLSVTANGQYSAPSGKAYSPVTVDVQPELEPLSVTENGTYIPETGVDGFSSVSVNVPQGGGGGVASNAVNFRDYDGTIVASYSATDFANLTALPDNPSHDGLTAQGWNWSLTDAKAYVVKYGRLEIGQMYITTDGKTHVHIHLEQGRTSPMLGCCPNGTVDVDWGDGTTHDTLTGTSTSTVKWTPNHAYAAPGDYVIKLTVTGSMGLYGSNSINQYSGLLRYSSSADSRNYAYQNTIKMVEIGSGVTSIGNNAFLCCFSLANITMPDGITSIGSYVFSNCYGLANITIPDGITSIGSYAFSNCYSLANITMPDGIISIRDHAFYYCYSLANITMPDGVTSIGNHAFYYCYSLANITMPDGVTSIGGYAFSNCFSLANITMPDGVTSIGNNTFYYCYSLVNIIIPDDVTSIGGNAFSDCYSLAEIHFKPDTPPTAGANAFSKIPTDCIIYVPTGSLSAYTSAANYPSSSTYTYVEE